MCEPPEFVTFFKLQIPIWNIGIAIHPLTNKSDLHLISPYNHTIGSNIKVMRIKDMITN